MHNQKIDFSNLHQLILNIEGQIVSIEQKMKNNIKLTADLLKDQAASDIQGSLQAHLNNA